MKLQRTFWRRLALLLTIVSVLFLPQPGNLAPVQKKVLLTFDDGPDVRYTAHVLDTLALYEIKGLFFWSAARWIVIRLSCSRRSERGTL